MSFKRKVSFEPVTVEIGKVKLSIEPSDIEPSLWVHFILYRDAVLSGGAHIGTQKAREIAAVLQRGTDADLPVDAGPLRLGVRPADQPDHLYWTVALCGALSAAGDIPADKAREVASVLLAAADVIDQQGREAA